MSDENGSDTVDDNPFASLYDIGSNLWLDADGIGYQDHASLIQAKLNMCGCGDPESNLLYIRRGLGHILALAKVNEAIESDSESWDTAYDRWNQEGLELFGSHEARDFFFYWADSEDLTEHGSSIPGWLTERGHQLLQALSEYG